VTKSFYAQSGKRALDCVLSGVGLVALAPFLLLISAFVKCSSRGPILFRQTRVGKDGRPFQILKFRSMIAEASARGPGITASDDQRITALGRILREWKIDELPQLYNVLRGDMSLVGPRPELPAYVRLYTPEQRQILSVRPGITDPASLAYRSEGELLQRSSDPEGLYRETILPSKLFLNRQYIMNVSLSKDVLLMLSTIELLLFRSEAKHSPLV
jgi:lipopolysaccharide/colanic/teichoic acid biosynthesis glycosyltransferase